MMERIGVAEVRRRHTWGMAISIVVFMTSASKADRIAYHGAVTIKKENSETLVIHTHDATAGRSETLIVNKKTNDTARYSTPAYMDTIVFSEDGELVALLSNVKWRLNPQILVFQKDGRLLGKKRIECEQIPGCHGSVTNWVYWYDPKKAIRLGRDSTQAFLEVPAKEGKKAKTGIPDKYIRIEVDEN